MANIRLDGCVYTAESMRAAYRRVGDQGMLSLAFYVSHRPWMIHKLFRMVEEGTGKAPLVYASTDTSRVVLIVPKGRELTGPVPVPAVNLIDLEPIGFPIATDDWPYLYLAYRTIPSDYLLVLILVPRDWILVLPWSGRLAWTLLAVPLPIFFAGLVFSTTFKREAQPASAFGANLLGATVGGFAEYLGMVVGSQTLSLLVIACYLCSYLVLRRVWPKTNVPVLEPATA